MYIINVKATKVVGYPYFFLLFPRKWGKYYLHGCGLDCKLQKDNLMLVTN
jgi:hypothetical protein